jgi:hypothetical protein
MLEFKVTLRVTSRIYTLQELKEVLGESTSGFTIGDYYSNGKQQREFTLWALESSKSPSSDFESHLGEILTYLKNRYSYMSTLRDNCEMDLFCLFSSDNGQGGAEISASTMKVISSYNLNLVFDVLV